MTVEGKDDTREVFVSNQAYENQRLVGVESVVEDEEEYGTAPK